MCVGEVGNAISKLCTSQATKNILVDGSDEPCYVHWDGEKANGCNTEMKYVQTYSN